MLGNFLVTWFDIFNNSLEDTNVIVYLLYILTSRTFIRFYKTQWNG